MIRHNINEMHNQQLVDFFSSLVKDYANVVNVTTLSSHNFDANSWINSNKIIFLNTCFNEKKYISDFFLNDIKLSDFIVIKISPSFSKNEVLFSSETGWISLLNSIDVNCSILCRYDVALNYYHRENSKLLLHWSKCDPLKLGMQIGHELFIVLRNHDNAPRNRDKSNIFPPQAILTEIQKSKEKNKDNLRLFYLVHFFQDFIFLRSFISFSNIGDVVVIINEGNLCFHHKIIVTNFLAKNNICYFSISNFNVSSIQSGDLVITATIGPLSPMHLSCSNFFIEARNNRAITITIQHGLTIPDEVLIFTEYFLAWNELAAAVVKNNSKYICSTNVLTTGGFRLPVVKDASFFQKKLGAWSDNFKYKVLVATNLHWSEANIVSDEFVLASISSLATKNKDVLFFLRPHPEDYKASTLNSIYNLIIVDDIITGLMDVTVDDLVSNVNLVITTFSTIIYDASRNRTPFVLFDFDHKLKRTCQLYPEIGNLHVVNCFHTFDIDLFLKHWSENEIYPETLTLDKLQSLFANSIGSPVSLHDKAYIEKLNAEYKLIAPDYGRSAFKEKLEKMFY